MNSLLNQTVSIARPSGSNKYGRLTYGGATSYKCRVELKERRRFLPNGEVLVTHGKVFLPPDALVDSDDKLTYSNTVYRVFTVNSQVGANGAVHHLTVEIMKWTAT